MITDRTGHHSVLLLLLIVSLVFMRGSHAVLRVESGSSCLSVFAQILHQHTVKDVAMKTRKIKPCPE